MSMNTVVIWDRGGKVKATLFASRREAFKVVPVADQTSMLAVHVTTTEQFHPARDYVVRVVTKGTRPVENELVVGTLPKWAGGTEPITGRVVIAEPSRAEVFERVQPVSAAHQREWIERDLPVVGPWQPGSLLCFGDERLN